MVPTQPAQDLGQLLPDQQEHESLEQEIDQLPHRPGLQPAGPGLATRRVVTHHQPRDDNGEHPGHMGLFTGQVRGEGQRE